MSLMVYRQAIGNERDLVDARARAIVIAAELGFPAREQTQIATAVSEIGRNALIHAGKGEIEFHMEPGESPQRLRVVVSDSGPGMRDAGMVDPDAPRENGAGRGMGLVSAQRLVDRFHIESKPGNGTVVSMEKNLPVRSGDIGPDVAARLQVAMKRAGAADPMRLLQAQNRELLEAMAAERERQDELGRLSQELEETNRGVVALYAELDEKAEYLRRASELKSRFLSNMSHEFRTPLSSILALSRLLMDQVDGPLLSEQQKQVTYIRKSAEGLLELINDLLDLAKVEAGKLSINSTDFSVGDLFGGLRGALRPLITRDTVSIGFAESDALPPLHTDEGKVAQILRNFIVNAMRFTERGSIEVTARHHAAEDMLEFAVKDSGVGIAQEDQDMIFEEFGQVEGALQRETKGTGLGLPLSKQLAELLGGHIQLASKLGEGSTFALWIPRSLEAPLQTAGPAIANRRVLVVDDEDTFRYIIRQLLGGIANLEITEARTAVEGIARARHERPDAIILDVLMPNRGGQEVLRVLKADPDLRDIPIFVTTSLPVTDRLIAEMNGARSVMAKQNLSSESLRAALSEVIAEPVGR
ncbi:MAG TPA: ATP-binding protein [Dongiaceae bacterium]|jgi:signal transduction histidine kinase